MCTRKSVGSLENAHSTTKHWWRENEIANREKRIRNQMEWLWMANRKLLPSNFTTIQQTVQFDGYTRCALLIFGENIGRHYLLKYAICCGYFHSIDQLQSRNQFFFRPWAEQKVNKKRTKMKTHSSFDSQQFVWARKRLLQRHSNRHSLLDAVGSVPLANFRNVESNIFFLPVFDSRRTKSYVCGGMLEGNADNKKKNLCVSQHFGIDPTIMY